MHGDYLDRRRLRCDLDVHEADQRLVEDRHKLHRWAGVPRSLDHHIVLVLGPKEAEQPAPQPAVGISIGVGADQESHVVVRSRVSN